MEDANDYLSEKKISRPEPSSSFGVISSLRSGGVLHDEGGQVEMEEMTLGSFVKERITRARQWKLLTKATSRLETTDNVHLATTRPGCHAITPEQIRYLHWSERSII